MTTTGPSNTTQTPAAQPSKPSSKKRLLNGVAIAVIGGAYFGVPLYIALKKRESIGKAFKGTYTFIKGHISHQMFDTPRPAAPQITIKPETAALLAKVKKRPVVAGLAAIFTTAAVVGGTLWADSALRTETSPNFDRFLRYGATGLVFNALAQANADSKAGVRSVGTSLFNRLLFKGSDVGAGTAAVAGKLTDTARDILASGADPKDEEGKIIFAKPLSEKFVTVCVNRSDFSNPVKDAKGHITWEKKTGPQAEADNKKIPAYAANLNTAADELKKPDSALRKALQQSASGVVIIEPGYIKENAVTTIQEGTSCPDLRTKEYRYNAETYLNSQGTGHLPPNPLK